MFVTRPAVSEIYVEFLGTVPPDGMGRNEQVTLLFGTVKNANGVTMGQLRETEWIDNQIERRYANGIGTRVRLTVYEYGMWAVRPILFLDIQGADMLYNRMDGNIAGSGGGY